MPADPVGLGERLGADPRRLGCLGSQVPGRLPVHPGGVGEGLLDPCAEVVGLGRELGQHLLAVPRGRLPDGESLLLGVGEEAGRLQPSTLQRGVGPGLRLAVQRSGLEPGGPHELVGLHPRRLELDGSVVLSLLPQGGEPGKLGAADLLQLGGRVVAEHPQLHLGLLSQPVGVGTGPRRQVARLLLGHPQDLLSPTPERREVGGGPRRLVGGLQLGVVPGQGLVPAPQVGDLAVRIMSERVHGGAVVPAAHHGKPVLTARPVALLAAAHVHDSPIHACRPDC